MNTVQNNSWLLKIKAIKLQPSNPLRGLQVEIPFTAIIAS